MKKTTKTAKPTKPAVKTTKPTKPAKPAKPTVAATPAKPATTTTPILPAPAPAKHAPAAKKPQPQPPMSWEALKIRFSDILESAAGKIVYKPKSTAGLVRVNTLGLYIKRDRLPAFCEAQRQVSAMRRAFLDKFPTVMFEAEIKAANGSEAIALTALGLTFHDDRGDALLYVPSFRSVKFLNAWLTAAANAGVTASKVRAA